ncbi:hypothetical protein [Chryseobacterium taichungense]|uniref:hypothetical protein n=1 Tax=Chryseobacterium taichungense TaxID=295069 RepID=UPI0028AEE631|nr:hypothetical protein [Chryseobacterium taichungense]
MRAIPSVSAQTAADYGWINRAFPDDELDAFVENLAKRIDSFDLKIIRKIKATMNERVIIPKNEHIMETQIAFFASLTEPEARTRIKKLLDQGLQTYGDVELNLGKYL